MTAAVLSVAAVSKRYRDRWVLRDANLTIMAGERVALLGESGAGKSTLLNLIAGLEPPDEGTIVAAGCVIGSADPDAAAAFRRERLGFVFQAFHLLPHLDLIQNVAVPLLLIGCAADEARARSSDMLSRLGLGERGASLPRELSGGEQQRVALARALVHRPALVLADEPTGNLDPATADRALTLIAEQVRLTGAALLMATHSEHAAAFADTRYRIVAGAIVPA